MDINIITVTNFLIKFWSHAQCYKVALFKLSYLPADGTLTVGRSLCNAQGLPNLCLSQTQGQSPKFESFCKLLDFIQIDPIYNVAVRLVDGWLICAKIRENVTFEVSPLPSANNMNQSQLSHVTTH